METFQLPPRKSLAEFLETCSKGGKDGIFAAKTDRPPAKKGDQSLRVYLNHRVLLRMNGQHSALRYTL